MTTTASRPCCPISMAFSSRLQRCAELAGQRELGLDAGLGTHEAAHRIVVALVAVPGGEGGKALPQLRCVELLVRDVPGLGGLDRRLQEIVRTVRFPVFAGRADHQHAIAGEQGFARLGFEFLPDLVRAPDEGRVMCTLGTGDPRDAALAMARSQPVRRRVLVDPQHPGAALRQLIGGGRPHRAQPEDDDVVSFRHGCSTRTTCLCGSIPCGRIERADASVAPAAAGSRAGERRG